MAKYDQREAKLLMADAKERATPNVSARDQSARDLLDSLLSLNGQYGFDIDRNVSTATSVSYPHPQASEEKGEAQITYKAGAFFVQRGQTSMPIEGLTWDHRSGQWQGPPMGEKDGTPVRCSALAALVGAALGLSDDALRNALSPSPVPHRDWSEPRVIPSGSRWGDDE